MNHVSQKLSVLEKFGYSLGDLAANLVFQTLMTYLAYFYTDIYGLNATDATAIMFIVGTVAAFGFNPIIGALADRTNSKWGKFRPWILYTSIPLGVISVMAFSTPNFSYDGKVIYAVITYTLLLLFYASSNLPYSALSGVIIFSLMGASAISLGIAVGLSVFVMASFNAIHPPAGANPIIAILGGKSLSFVLMPVALGAIFIILFALFYNKLLKRDYP